MAMESWLPIDERGEFGLQNVPFGACRINNPEDEMRYVSCCTRIGDHVVVLSELCANGVGCFGKEEYGRAFARGNRLNEFMALGRDCWREVRREIQSLFVRGGCPGIEANAALESDRTLRDRAVLRVEDVEMLVPARIGDYTDFYASREHATNVGIMFRGRENALQPNWLHLPVGYHGRASSVVASGTPLRRPRGQLAPAPPSDAPGAPKMPRYAECAALDFELEMGVFIGPGSSMGTPVDMAHARDHIFGLVLLNDWSARDIQRWEYVPLGPFNAKNFGTSVSPWVVTMEALEPFRCDAVRQEPEVLPYLSHGDGGAHTFDIGLEVAVNGSVVCRSNLRHLYWTLEQLVAHHTSTGCNLNAGDLLGTGTISGPGEDEFGSMLELSWGNTKDVRLGETGETRRYLNDGDSVTLRGVCGGDGSPTRIGFGVCEGSILPAI